MEEDSQEEIISIVNSIFEVSNFTKTEFSLEFRIDDIEFKSKFEGLARRMENMSFVCRLEEIDGHRVEQIDAAITKANATKGVPTMIISRTVKGKSLEHMEDNPIWHGKAPASDIVPIINLELDSQFMIAPSIIAGDMTNLENEIKRCVSGRADYIHLDVMDGQFVPNKTFDHLKIKELRPLTVIPFDTHLMINEPVKHIRDYIDAGSDIITVHAEVTDESSFGEIHDLLKQNQIGIGFAINPDTELLALLQYLQVVDENHHQVQQTIHHERLLILH